MDTPTDTPQDQAGGSCSHEAIGRLRPMRVPEIGDLHWAPRRSAGSTAVKVRSAEAVTVTPAGILTEL